jgi:SAM-dependent methyltransferase
MEAKAPGDIDGPQPKLYRELASWFHLLTAPEEYAEEAALYGRLLAEESDRAPRTVLELGSGGGNNASHLKARFTMTLVDRSSDMLELSRTINPDCEHVVGDMRSVRLNRVFDAVFVHDAIAHITTESDLRATMETAWTHCRPGGVALCVPDYTLERFRPRTDWGGHDGSERSLRYLEWTWDPDPDDSTYVVDFAYLLRDGAGTISVKHDRHTLGVFARKTWLRLLEEVGFRPELRRGDLTDAAGTELFLSRKET